MLYTPDPSAPAGHKRGRGLLKPHVCTHSAAGGRRRTPAPAPGTCHAPATAAGANTPKSLRLGNRQCGQPAVARPETTGMLPVPSSEAHDRGRRACWLQAAGGDRSGPQRGRARPAAQSRHPSAPPAHSRASGGSSGGGRRQRRLPRMQGPVAGPYSSTICQLRTHHGATIGAW